MAGRKDWCTPPDIVRSVRDVFGGSIGLDPCSNAYSLVGAEVEFRLPDRDGLVEPWLADTIFVSPPYGADPASVARRSSTGSSVALMRPGVGPR
jgi:hypothetical protein